MQWFDPLAVRLSRSYTHTSDPQEEAYQEARIGLIRAYRSFDITRGSFPAYAQQCMFTAVMDYLRHEDPIPISTRRRSKSLPEWFLSLAETRQPFPAEVTAVAAEVRMTPTRVRSALVAHFHHTQSDVPSTWPADQDVEAEATHHCERSEVLAIMDTWSARNRSLFLESLFTGADQKQLAHRYSISQARVSQILSACWADINTKWTPVSHPRP